MSDGVDRVVAALAAELDGRRIIRLGDSHAGGVTDHVSVVLNGTDFVVTDGVQARVQSEDIAVTSWSDRDISQAWDLQGEVEEILFEGNLSIAPLARSEVFETAVDGGWRGIECIYRVWNQ